MVQTDDLVELLSVVENKGVDLGIRCFFTETLVLQGYHQHQQM
jgi:hypothetical protein